MLQLLLFENTTQVRSLRYSSSNWYPSGIIWKLLRGTEPACANCMSVQRSWLGPKLINVKKCVSVFLVHLCWESVGTLFWKPPHHYVSILGATEWDNWLHSFETSWQATVGLDLKSSMYLPLSAITLSELNAAALALLIYLHVHKSWHLNNVSDNLLIFKGLGIWFFINF